MSVGAVTAVRSHVASEAADGSGDKDQALDRTTVADPQYGLRDVVAITGLTKETVYAWERRYAIVEPNRDEQGARTYADHEVYRLQLLKQCVDAGHRIGNLVSLELGALRGLAKGDEAAGSIDLDNLVRAVESLDVNFIEHWLPIHFSALGPSRFARDVVVPLMTAVGACVETGRASIAGEHLISSAVRTLLGQALRLSKRPGAGPTVLFTTPSGELHELGALVAAVCAQQLGAHAIYMGPQLPAREIWRASSKLNSRLVCMSTMSLPRSELEREVPEIRLALPHGTELWLGGSAATAMGAPLKGGLLIYEDMLEFEDAIKRFIVRAGR